MNRQTELEAKERLFGGDHSDELRKQMIKVRFLQNLSMPSAGTGGELTSDHGDGATEPQHEGLSVEPVRIGRFTVLRKLGQGGMGVVYAAYDEQLDRQVALKLLNSELCKDERGRVRMQREAQALARLSHPNVVQVHEIGQWRDHDYVAMEFLAGQTLREWVKEKERSWGEVLDVMVQAGRGLAAAHAAGLVHRDFKPANLLVGDDGRPRVLDFGLARAAADVSGSHAPVSELLETEERGSERGPHEPDSFAQTNDLAADSGPISGSGSGSAFDQLLTATGAVLGTPAYMAPEQHLGERATELSDQFSFCLVLYEALFGERPYKANSRNEYAVRVTDGDFSVPGPSSGVPGWLRHAVCRGLAPRPADRWISMQALLAELSRDRARLWKRSAVAAGLFASIGVAVALGGVEPEPKVCEFDRSVVADSWGQPQREAMKAAFAATKLSGADRVFEQAARDLDAYADELVAGRTAACAQRWVEQAQTDQQLELRMHCLTQREGELAAVVGVLAEADHDVVLHASELLGGLGAVDMCARVDLLERNTPVPKDEVSAAAIAEARRDIASAEAAGRAGRIDQAAQLTASVAQRAADLGYEPLLAEVAYLEGLNHLAARKDTPARIAFIEALRLAERSDYAELRARAWLKIARLSQHAEPNSSFEFMLAEAGVSLLGDRPIDRHALHMARGRAFDAQGQLEVALAEYDEAVKLAQAGFLGSDHELAGALKSRSSTAASVGRAEQARADLASALALRTQLGADDINILGVTYDLAIVELEQEDFAGAELHFSEAIASFERVYGPRYTNIGHAYLGLAQIAVRREQYPDAERLITQALGVLDVNHEDHAWALDALASAQLKRESYLVAVDTLERAVDHVQDVAPDDTLQLGYRRGRLGYALDLLGQHERALEQLDRALELLDTDPPTLDQVRPLNDRGSLLLEMGQPERALPSFERAVELTPLDSGRPWLAAEARLGLAAAVGELGDHARQRELAIEAEALVRDIPAARALLERAKELQGT